MFEIYRFNLMDLSGRSNFGGFCGIIKSNQEKPEITLNMIIYKSR